MRPLPTIEQLAGCHGKLLTPCRIPPTPAGQFTNPLQNWYDWIVPTYSQQYDSCVGHAWANWLEAMLRRYVRKSIIGQDRQINGDWIWMQARKKHWGGVLKGGIFIAQGFEAMIDLGWLPPDAILVEVPGDFSSYNDALALTPVVQGHEVTADWLDAAHDNGCIPPRYKPMVRGGGHATLGIATARQDGALYRVLENSWGEDWGWHGLGLMTDEFWLTTTLDDAVYTAALPDGRDWSELASLGWKDALISTPR